MVDRSESPDPPSASWPDLIRCVSGRSGERAWSLALPDGMIEAEASSVAGGVVATSAGVIRADLVVLATGSSFEPPTFPGHRKPGVVVLRSFREYEWLGRESASMEEVSVTGEGGRGLEVAERLSGPGRRVNLFVSCWQSDPPSSLVFDVISVAASKMGVSVNLGRVTRAYGAGRLEAVLANGSVFPCDTLAHVPRKVPRAIRSASRAGPLGGHLVDLNFRTSIPTILAAGGCAEVAGGRPGRTFEGEPALSGRMAGASCTALAPPAVRARLKESFAFGLRWSRFETVPSPWGNARTAKVARRWDESSACEITFETASKRVVRIDSVERSPPVGLHPFPVPYDLSLGALAYSLGSSDISLISETARLALKECRRS